MLCYTIDCLFNAQVDRKNETQWMWWKQSYAYTYTYFTRRILYLDFKMDLKFI